MEQTEETTQVETHETQTEYETENVVKQTNHFEDIDPLKLNFSLQFNCAKSTAGQTIRSFYDLKNCLLGENGCAKMAPTNKFQESLYPNMTSLCGDIVDMYMKTFVNDVSDQMEKEIYGYNLNGKFNNGQLGKYVSYKGLPPRYESASFVQCVNLLIHRLKFITTRDHTTIKRYVDDEVARNIFVKLQSQCLIFLTYLNDDVYTKWTECVRKAKSEGSNRPVPIKLNITNVENKNNRNNKSTGSKKNFNKHYNKQNVR